MSEKTKINNQTKGPKGGHGGGPMMGKHVEKPKDFKGTFKRLLKYLSPYKAAFLFIFIASVLSTVFNIVSPKIMGLGTDKIAEGFKAKLEAIKLGKDLIPSLDFAFIEKILLILLVLYVFSSIFDYVQQYIMAGVSQKIVYDIRKDVDIKLSKLPLKYYDGRTHGEILSRVTNDIDNIANTLQQGLTQIIRSVVTIVGIIIIMFTINVTLSVIVLATLPLYIVVTMFIAKKSQKFYKSQQKILGDLNGHVEEMFTGHVIVKSFNRQQKSIEKFKKINEDLYDSSWKAQFISGIIMPLMRFIGDLSYILICIVGGLLAYKNRIGIGGIQAFLQYSRRFTEPITQMANIVNLLQSAIASAERVFEVLDEEEEIPDKNDNKVLTNPQGNIKFEHVKFGYKKDVTLIEDMSIDVKKGQTIAIVGPTGAGKTTLVNLLMRFYEIDGGRITIDGVDIRDLKREDLRSLFGMVLQDTWLFNGTIKENIAYGRSDVSELDIIKAAKTAHADHFIRTLPDGYDTILNEEASNISQGQKQLITIARALLADPKILILDEATSSVDTRTEAYIQNAMTKLMEGRTNFVIAHRLSTIHDADLILVMNQGSIIEKGNHKELMEQNGFYADLYNSQFKGNKEAI